MLTLLRRFWKTLLVLAGVYGLFWLPKDIEDAGQAAEPWQRAWAMVDQNSALWFSVVVLGLWIIWTDLRPYWRGWRGPKFPDRHREICRALADQVSKLSVAAMSAHDWVPIMDTTPWARMQERGFMKASTRIDLLLPQISYDLVTVGAIQHYSALCMRLVVAVADKGPVAKLQQEVAKASGPLFEMLHGGKRLSENDIQPAEFPEIADEKPAPVVKESR